MSTPAVASFWSVTARARGPQRDAVAAASWHPAHVLATGQAKDVLFPGRDDARSIDPTVLHTACRSAVKAAGLTKRVTAPQLRDASAGERNRHPNHPGSARPQQSVVDGALHAGRDPYVPRDPKSVRSSDSGSHSSQLSARGPGAGLAFTSRSLTFYAGMATPIVWPAPDIWAASQRRVMSADRCVSHSRAR